MCHSVHVEVREQLGGVHSLPIPCGTQGGAQSQAIRLGSKLLYPLSHHAGPSWREQSQEAAASHSRSLCQGAGLQELLALGQLSLFMSSLLGLRLNVL